MDHFEAQSYIMPFIEGKLPLHKQEDFVLHMKSCPKCHEELEVYYTLLTGMKQLDGNEKLSDDFAADLDNKLYKMHSRAKGRYTFKVSAFSIVMAVMIVVVMIFYTACISQVYTYEQNTKLLSQGQYYFSSRMETKLFDYGVDRVVESQLYTESEAVTDFQRIKRYNQVKEGFLHQLDVGIYVLNNSELVKDEETEIDINTPARED